MNIKNNPIDNINRINKNSELKNRKKPNIGHEFESILKDNISKKKDIKISAHAKARIAERNLGLSELDIPKIEETIDKLDEKGAKESLLIYKDMAIIVSVDNRTVITAMDFKDGMEAITNIDSAVKIK